MRSSLRIEAESKRNGRSGPFHSFGSQAGDAVTDVAFGDCLEIIEIRGAGRGRPSSSVSTSSVGMLRIVEVMGAIVTEFNTKMADSEVRKTACHAGGRARAMQGNRRSMEGTKASVQNRGPVPFAPTGFCRGYYTSAREIPQ